MPSSTSTTPSTPKVIAIKITSGVKGQPITITNRTTGDLISTTLKDTGQAIVDLENMESGYTAGDVIDITVSGERVGSTSLTTTARTGQTVTVATSALTTALSRGI